MEYVYAKKNVTTRHSGGVHRLHTAIRAYKVLKTENKEVYVRNRKGRKVKQNKTHITIETDVANFEHILEVDSIYFKKHFSKNKLENNIPNKRL